MDWVKHKDFFVRPGTLDYYVVDEIASYKPFLDRLIPRDVVMDIGANIGTISRTAQRFVDAPVIAIEPDPANIQLLRENAPKALIIPGAVVEDGYQKEEVNLYQNLGKNKGLHSTVPTRGRSIIRVHPFCIGDLLSLHKPTAVKIDCEGAEYSFLVPTCMPGVNLVMIEYNLSRRGEQDKAKTMHGRFIGHGWTCVKQPRLGTKAWATMACYER
jgi:FkbM family methyltransferase